jgi:hypothetical protein
VLCSYVNTYTAVCDIINTYTAVCDIINTYTAVCDIINTYTAVCDIINTYTAVRDIINTYTAVRDIINNFICIGQCVTHYGLDDPVIRIGGGGGRDFPHSSRQTLGITRPPIKWVPVPSRGRKRPELGVHHPTPSSTEVKER